MIKTCPDCGKTMEMYGTQVRCPECQEKHRKFLISMRHKQRKENWRSDPLIHYFTCGHNDCRFAMTGDHLQMCDFMAIHIKEHPEADSHKRPCAATPDCSCYEKGRRKRKRWE